MDAKSILTFFQPIQLFYFNSNLDIAIITTTPTTWFSTPLGQIIPQHQAGSTGELAAYVHECSLCANETLLAHLFNGQVDLYNYTLTWENTTLITDALAGSKLGFQPNSLSDEPDVVNLYYQAADSTRSMPANASISAIYFGDSVSNGSAKLVEVLTSGDDLTGIYIYRSADHVWFDAGPEYDIESGIQNVTRGTAIAANNFDRAYVMADGELTQLGTAYSDSVPWTVHGVVPTL